MRIAAVLQFYQLNLVRMILVGDAVVKDKKSIGVEFNDTLDLILNDRRRHVVVLQVSIDCVIRKMPMVIREVGLCVIRLSGNIELAVVALGWLHRLPLIME